MLGWFKSRQRSDNERLQAEVREFELKAAASAPIVADAGGAFGAPWQLSQPSLGQHRQQLAAFNGYAYTCVSAIAKRIAERELFVARVPTSPAGPGAAGYGPRTMKASGGEGGMRRRKSLADGLEPLPTHPLIDLLGDPNPVMVRWTLLYVTVAALELTGRAYWWIKQTPDGWELWPLPPHLVTPIHAKGQLFAGWKVKPDGNAEGFTLPAEAVCYFFLPDPADPLGAISPLQAQAKSINIDEMLQQSQAADFRNGVKPSVILKAGRIKDSTGRPMDARHILTPEQRQQLINAINKAFAGYTKTGGTMIVDGLIEEITEFGRKPSEMGYLDSGSQVRSRIFQAFGVNPLIVGEIEGANRAQAVVAEESFCANVVNPLLTLMSQTITAWVCPIFAADGQRFEAWFDPCRANDDELTFKQWSLGLARGACTNDEYRIEVLGLPAMEKPASSPANESGGEAAGAATIAPDTVADVQATALNGAQIDSLLRIAEMVSAGELTPEAARALIAAAFPLLGESAVDRIVSALKPGTVTAAISPAAAELAKSLNPYNLRPLEQKRLPSGLWLK